MIVRYIAWKRNLHGAFPLQQTHTALLLWFVIATEILFLQYQFIWLACLSLITWLKIHEIFSQNIRNSMIKWSNENPKAINKELFCSGKSFRGHSYGNNFVIIIKHDKILITLFVICFITITIEAIKSQLKFGCQIVFCT